MTNYLNPATGTVHSTRQCARRMAYGNVVTTDAQATCGLCRVAPKAARPAAVARPTCITCPEPTSHKSGQCSLCRDLQ